MSITEPNGSAGGNKTALAKTATVELSSPDTLISLPKSGKTIIIREKLPTDKLEMLDKYLQKNKNGNGSPIINPDALQCNYYYDSYRVGQNNFRPVQGNICVLKQMIHIYPYQKHK